MYFLLHFRNYLLICFFSCHKQDLNPEPFSSESAALPSDPSVLTLLRHFVLFWESPLLFLSSYFLSLGDAGLQIESLMILISSRPSLIVNYNPIPIKTTISYWWSQFQYKFDLFLIKIIKDPNYWLKDHKYKFLLKKSNYF